MILSALIEATASATMTAAAGHTASSSVRTTQSDICQTKLNDLWSTLEFRGRSLSSPRLSNATTARDHSPSFSTPDWSARPRHPTEHTPSHAVPALYWSRGFSSPLYHFCLMRLDCIDRCLFDGVNLPCFHFCVSGTKTHLMCLFSRNTKSCLEVQTPLGVPIQVSSHPFVVQVRVTLLSSGGGSNRRWAYPGGVVVSPPPPFPFPVGSPEAPWISRGAFCEYFSQNHTRPHNQQRE